LTLWLDHEAHVLSLLEYAHRVHRRGEVRDIQAPAQIFRQRGLEELHDDVLALLADVDAGARVREIDDHAALAGAPAPEIDIAHGMLRVGLARREVLRLAPR